MNKVCLFDSYSFFGGLDELIFQEDNRLGWEALSETIMSYNAQFAKTGNPNVEELTKWAP